MLVFMCNPFKKVRSKSCLQVQTCRSTSCQREQPRPIGFSILVNYVKFNIISSNNVSFHVQHIRSVRSTTARIRWCAVILSKVEESHKQKRTIIQNKHITNTIIKLFIIFFDKFCIIKIKLQIIKV